MGPVTVPEELLTTAEVNAQADYYEGQYISAGYSGHGMPRAFAWLVPCVSLHSDHSLMLIIFSCSAEVVASMIKARITGEEWTKPYWFPEHYLTWARRA